MGKSPEGYAEAVLSIGDLAEASGISRDTIRVWERRYGKPQPVRLPSGHRRYTDEHVRWLRRVAEALSRGNRAGKAVRASEKELDAMLAPGTGDPRDAPEVRELLGLVKHYDRDGLVRTLRDRWAASSPMVFAENVVGPLLTAVGRAWADDDLQVRHEHFVSEVLEDLLRTIRSELPPPSDSGPLVLLATMSGEPHGIGLQLAAMLAKVNGLRTKILGTETPRAEIVDAAREVGAGVVAISVSLSSGGVETDRQLAELRSHLPEHVALIIGGKGARGVRRGPRGIRYLDGLPGLDAYFKERRAHG